MNVVILQGRLTSNPEVKYGQGANQTAFARYTLAVDRYRKKEGGDNTDFIRCVAFGKAAEFAEKYLRKGMKISIRGRIQTGSYTNREGVKIYTTDIVVEEHHFCESRQAGGSQQAPAYGQAVRTQQTPAGAYSGQTGYQGQNYPNQVPQSQPYGAPAANQAANNRPGNSYAPAAQGVPSYSTAPGYGQAPSAPGAPSYGGPAGAGYSSPTGGYSVPGGTAHSGQGYTKDPNFEEGFMNIPDGIDEELPFN